MAETGGEHEGRPVLSGSRVDLGTGLEQANRRLGVAVGGGEHQRGKVVSPDVPGIGIRAVIEGIGDEIGSAGFRRHEQRQIGDVLGGLLWPRAGGKCGKKNPGGGSTDARGQGLDSEPGARQVPSEHAGRGGEDRSRPSLKLGINLAAEHLVNPDIVRWNKKYRSVSNETFAEPDALLIEYQAVLTGGARALDVACGAGANALFAALHGCRVVGVDASLEGLRIAANRAKDAGVSLSLLNVDLEVWRPPPECFDLVMVFRYLNREIFPSLKSTLRPGGVMIYKTFNRNFLEQKPEMNPDYLLEPGELARRFSRLEPIASNDRSTNREMYSWWIGLKPTS